MGFIRQSFSFISLYLNSDLLNISIKVIFPLSSPTINSLPKLLRYIFVMWFLLFEFSISNTF